MIALDKLKEILRGTVVIVGVGNTSRGDDGAGPALISEIEGRVAAQCIDGGVAPENYLEKIVQMSPDTVLIADAADIKAEPGEIRIVESGKIASGGLSTHAVSLGLVCEYLRERCPSSKTHLLAIQPCSTKAEGLSEAVRVSVHHAAELLIEALPLESGSD